MDDDDYVKTKTTSKSVNSFGSYDNIDSRTRQIYNALLNLFCVIKRVCPIPKRTPIKPYSLDSNVCSDGKCILTMLVN